MILHTIMPCEHVYGSLGEPDYQFTDLVVNGVSMQVQMLDPGTAKIVRLYSANLEDFLNPGLAPGAVLRFEPTRRE